MNYHNITSPDMLNGSGLRTVLWVSGCTHNCPGCHNPITHPFDSGIPFTQIAMDEIIEKSAPDYISGLTLSGGDPFMPQNINDCVQICKIFREKYPNKTIWSYTGYTIEELVKNPNAVKLLECLDVLVDGPFIKSKANKLLHFRGSSNQRIINVRESLTQPNLVLLEV